MEVFGTVSSALQTSAQIITFAVKVRSYVHAPKHIRASAENVENVGRNFRLVAIAVYECANEARFNPNFDIHPDLEMTFKDAYIALKATSKLVQQWARRLGLSKIWKIAEMSANEAFERSKTALPDDCQNQPDYPKGSDASTSTSPTIAQGCSSTAPRMGKNFRLPSFRRSQSTKPSQSSAIDEKNPLSEAPPQRAPSVRSSRAMKKILSLTKRGFGAIGHHLWWRICFVAYGSKDVDKAVGHLLHERLQLSVLTNTLPFRSSKRLKKAEEDIVNAWRDISQELRENRMDNVNIDPNSILPSIELPNSHDMHATIGGAQNMRLISVLKKKPEKAVSDWMVLMLQHIPPTIGIDVGILPCLGSIDWRVKDNGQTSALVFDAPRKSGNVHPVTLRACLLDRLSPPTISDRIRIAQTLVASVVVTHSLGIVHRFLNPEGILLFPDPKNPTSPGDLYLMGFGQSRREGEISDRCYHEEQFRDAFYIHHDIGSDPDSHACLMKHDIYSLGVCLLEIGLWQTPFVAMKNATQQFRDENHGRYHEKDVIFDPYGDFAELGEDFIRRRLLSDDTNQASEGTNRASEDSEDINLATEDSGDTNHAPEDSNFVFEDSNLASEDTNRAPEDNEDNEDINRIPEDSEDTNRAPEDSGFASEDTTNLASEDREDNEIICRAPEDSEDTNRTPEDSGFASEDTTNLASEDREDNEIICRAPEDSEDTNRAPEDSDDTNLTSEDSNVASEDSEDSNLALEVSEDTLEDSNIASEDIRSVTTSKGIADERRKVLVDIAKARLTPVMGQIYCDAVLACLEIEKVLEVKVERKDDSSQTTPGISRAVDSSNAGNVKGRAKPGAKGAKAGMDNSSSVDENEFFARFLLKLLEVRRMSNDSAKTINVTRNILKRLERISI